MKIDAKRHNPKEKRSFINMRGGQEDVTEILDEITKPPEAYMILDRNVHNDPL